MHRIALPWQHCNTMTINMYKIHAECLLPILCSVEIDVKSVKLETCEASTKISDISLLIIFDIVVLWVIN